MGVAYLKFRGENFHRCHGYKITKFVKIFSLESFLLYGNIKPLSGNYVYAYIVVKIAFRLLGSTK